MFETMNAVSEEGGLQVHSSPSEPRALPLPSDTAREWTTGVSGLCRNTPLHGMAEVLKKCWEMPWLDWSEAD